MPLVFCFVFSFLLGELFVSGFLSMASNFSAWAPGEPDYSGVEENCA